MNMESGFGWHYPPGTPGPRTEHVMVRCVSCEEVTPLAVIHDLGAVELQPEECPECGEPWDEDVLERAEPDEGPDPDDLREQQMEAQRQDAEDRQDERIENYPEEGA